MSFQIRNLMIKLAPDEREKRITISPTHDHLCLTACCDCQTSSKEEYERCGGPSRREDPDNPGAPEEVDEENRAGAEPNEALPGLGLLQHQLRQTLGQAG